MAIDVDRVLHVNLNCSDLAASLPYWRVAVGLEPQFHTAPTTQDCSALGLGQGRWDAWLLADPRGWESVVLDLLEWTEPSPTSTALDASSAGYHRLVFESSDLDSVVQRTGAHIVGEIGGERRLAFGRDPDGVDVAFIDGDRDRFATVTLNVVDSVAAQDFYCRHLGFIAREQPTTHGDGARTTTVTVLDDPRGNATFGLELIHRADIKRSPARTATDRGIFRMALLTDDLDRSVEALAAAGVACLGPPSLLDMGSGLPAVRAAFFRGTEGECLELIENPGV